MKNLCKKCGFKIIHSIGLYNTIQVLADVDPVANPQKPRHAHNRLYFQDVIFGNVGRQQSDSIYICQ